MTAMAATIYFFLTLPILFYVIFSDLRYMRIFNWTNIALFALFFPPAFFLFDLTTIGWQMVVTLIVLAISFALNFVGLMGGGDSKFLAAATPYILINDATQALTLMFAFVVTSISVLIAHRVLYLVPSFRARVADWVSWNHPKFAGRPAFPFGVILAGTVSGYLFIQAFIS